MRDPPQVSISGLDRNTSVPPAHLQSTCSHMIGEFKREQQHEGGRLLKFEDLSSWERALKFEDLSSFIFVSFYAFCFLLCIKLCVERIDQKPQSCG